MLADNIDSLECTLTGPCTSHRVNSMLVQRKATQEGKSTTEEEEFVQPTKRNCLRSLPANAVLREIAEYYSGKRSGPQVNLFMFKNLMRAESMLKQITIKG